jgi:hypothetical protein
MKMTGRAALISIKETKYRLFIHIAAHNIKSIIAQIIGILAVGRGSPHRPLGCRNKTAFRRSKTRLVPSPRRDGLRTPPAAAPAAVHQLVHRRNGDRPERSARDIVDLVEHFAQGLVLGRCIGGRGVLLNGAQILKQLGHIQQRRSPCIAGKLISATGAANRADEAGTAHDVHDLRQMVTGDAVLIANFCDGKLAAFARGQFENREDGQPGRNLQSHNIVIRVPLQSKS